MITGRVVKAYSGWYEVRVDQDTGPDPIICRPRGRLRRGDGGVLTGDRVGISLLDDGSGIIEEIFPRTSRLQRPPVANVDQVLIVFTLRQPPLNRPVLDRLACLAEFAGLGVVLVLNKLDLVTPAAVSALQAEYAPTGYPLLAVSARPPKGLAALRPLLVNRISVLAGPSGVGKSTLLNALQPDLRLQTQGVSRRLRRGRHTTRHVQLLPIFNGQGSARAGATPSAYVVDTPGFSQLTVGHIPKEELVYCFPEMSPLTDACRFDDCRHGTEPGCAVKAAVAAGQVAPARYEQYRRLFEELAAAERERYR